MPWVSIAMGMNFAMSYGIHYRTLQICKHSKLRKNAINVIKIFNLRTLRNSASLGPDSGAPSWPSGPRGPWANKDAWQPQTQGPQSRWAQKRINKEILKLFQMNMTKI